MIDFFERMSVFDDIKYYDEPHTYHIGDRRLTVSATGIVHKFTPPFDQETISKRCAKKEGITQAAILKQWRLKNVIGTTKGSVFHDYAENYLNNKIFAYPIEKLLAVPEFEGKDLIAEKIEILKPMFHRFHAKIQGRMLPIKSELVIGDPDLDMGGMIDQIFYNKKTGEFELWDWKTNGKFETYSPFKKKMLGMMAQYDACHLNEYSLQLAIYKLVIERRTGIKLGTSRLAWFFEGNSDVKIFDCIPMEKEAKLALGIS
jgi:hypothetical protein